MSTDPTKSDSKPKQEIVDVKKVQSIPIVQEVHTSGTFKLELTLLDPIIQEKKEGNQSEVKNMTELTAILRKTLTNNFDYFVEVHDKNCLESLEQWKSLTEDEKDYDGYPRGLRKILDKAAAGNSHIPIHNFVGTRKEDIFTSQATPSGSRKRTRSNPDIFDSNKRLEIQSYFTVLSDVKKVVKNHDFDLLELMRGDPSIILYDSREKLIRKVEHATKLLFTENQGGNRKNDLIIGLPSIGKSFLIKKIARTLGECLDDLVIVYLNVAETNFSISILEAIIDTCIAKKLPLESDSNAKHKLGTITNFIENCGMRLLLFIDEAQELYPSMNVTIKTEKTQARIDIAQEIYQICNHSDTLTYVTGSSVRLSNLAYKNIVFPFTDDYPNLNYSRLPCFHLFPILKRDEFQNCLKILKISEQNDINLYKICGGSIGILVSEKARPTLKKEYITEELLCVALQIWRANTLNQDEVDLYNRKYVSGRVLNDALNETLGDLGPVPNNSRDFDRWCDSGFLFNYNGSYSFLSMDLLLFVQTRENQLSHLEILGLTYPEGRNVGEKIYEVLIAEGICENQLEIQFQKITTEKISKDKVGGKWIVAELVKRVLDEQKVVCKVGPDKFGQDLLVCSYDSFDSIQKTIEFQHLQIKCGYSANTLVEKEISLLSNENVLKRFNELCTELTSHCKSMQIRCLHKKIVLTSKIIGTTLKTVLYQKGFETKPLDVASPYFPKRLKEYVFLNNTELFKNHFKKYYNYSLISKLQTTILLFFF